MKIIIYRAIALVGLVLTTSFLSAETIRYGGSTGWENTISEGLSKTTGWKGKEALTLAPAGRNPFANTRENSSDIDFLLLSTNNGVLNPSARYHIEGSVKNSYIFSARGETAMRPLAGGLRLYPATNAMFAPGQIWGSFSLEFLLRPINLFDGKIFFLWEGRDEQKKRQYIIARIENRRLIWEFYRFFRHEQGGIDSVINLTLTSSPLIPGEWQYHQIVFALEGSSKNRSGRSPGLLEYHIDGTSVDSIHTTPNGSESIEIYTPRIGNLSNQPIKIAPDFNGWIDELKLSSSETSVTSLSSYKAWSDFSHSVGRTSILNTGYAGSTLNSIHARFDAPGGSQIRFFIQSFETIEETQLPNMPSPQDPEWIEITMQAQPEDIMGMGSWHIGIPPKPLQGRYFVAGFIFQPDLVTDKSPVLSVLELDYSPKYPPSPPGNIIAEISSNGTPSISWETTTEQDIAGWWVSWGPHSREYFSDNTKDPHYGMVWVPRNTSSTKRPRFERPTSLANTVIYTSVQTAWREGSPDTSIPPLPLNFDALSVPSKEQLLYP